MSEKTLYEVLGVAETATAEEIRAAYRRKAKTLHPDVNNDDAVEFNRAKLAHDVLIDPERRRIYDETGDSRDVPKHANKERVLVMALLQQIMDGIVSADGPDDELDITDVPVKVLENLQVIGEEYGTKRRALAKKMRRANTLMKRLKRQDDEESVLHGVLKARIAKLDEESEGLAMAQRVHDEAVRIWSEYGYDVDMTNPHAMMEALLGGLVPRGGGRRIGGYRQLPRATHQPSSDEGSGADD